MRTVTFQSVLDAIATKVLGRSDNLPAQAATAFTASINEHVRDCWDRDFWPEWTLTEQRYFRDAWTATNYSSGDEVYHAASDAYYQANASATGTDVPGVSAKWTELTGTNLRRYVSFDQTSKTAIGAVDTVTLKDPRIYPGAQSVGWTIGPDGIEISAYEPVGTYVWVRFRKVAPEFTSTAWAAGSYASGARVLYTTNGECYLANDAATSGDVPGTSTKWTKLDFPAVLKKAVVLFATADSRNEDGQIESKRDLQSDAEDALIDEWRKVQNQQGQVDTFRVLTRPGLRVPIRAIA